MSGKAAAGVVGLGRRGGRNLEGWRSMVGEKLTGKEDWGNAVEVKEVPHPLLQHHISD